MSGKPQAKKSPSGGPRAGRPRTAGTDRTKHGPTPRRDAGRDRPGRRSAALAAALLGALFALAGVALGVALTVAGAIASAEIRDRHHQPVLGMTVTECRTTGEYRNLTRHCRGTDPAGRPLTYDGAPDSYRPGTVADVHCAPDGSCTTLGVGRHAVTALITTGGPLLAGACLCALTVILTRTFAPTRLPALRRPTLIRRLTATAAAVLTLTLTADLLLQLT
ncbi:hypothetical protein ACIQBJ_00215 [Kitasatospora sp. NPDC088391]|uniref:hypothetical protein n=1 Tax=Kitasatospora sp. NPDC088391 TaxID=3364074 RepID=UPI0037F99150